MKLKWIIKNLVNDLKSLVTWRKKNFFLLFFYMKHFCVFESCNYFKICYWFLGNFSPGTLLFDWRSLQSLNCAHWHFVMLKLHTQHSIAMTSSSHNITGALQAYVLQTIRLCRMILLWLYDLSCVWANCFLITLTTQ